MPERSLVRLEDGRPLEVRPLRPADAPALVLFFGQLSPQDVRRRFFGPKKELTVKEATRLAGVDQRSNVAICAVEPGPVGGRLVAVGRFHATGPGRAELALAVSHVYQGTGLGRELLTRLLHIARDNGLEVLEAQVLAENAPMLHLLSTAGRPFTIRQRGDVLTFELRLGCDQPERRKSTPEDRVADPER
jgi:RimJ/RimL family protein N-acetyltransferase